MFSIQSRGEIDTNALRLMGASVKGDDAIGEFGSGLKYAIACLLREGIHLSVFSGTREINISTVTESFRGSDFRVIIIDGERTSITTRTGPKWTPREAIRELWSNALDEGEASKSDSVPLLPRPGFTTIHIGDHPAIQSMFDYWDQYFLGDVLAIYTHPSFGSIHKQATPNFFRRGVWICQEAKPLPLFSYNFSAQNCPSLPESRLVSAQACTSALGLLLGACCEPEVMHKLIERVNKLSLEWSALRTYSYYISPEFKNAMTDILKLTYTHVGQNTSRVALHDKIKSHQIVLWCDSDAYDVLSSDVGIPTIEDSIGVNDRYEILPWPIGVKEIVDERLAFLASHDIKFPPETAFHFAEFRSRETLAEADTKNHRCLLSHQVANCGATRLTQALVEEWTHLYHGVRDHTLAQQHVYLNLITRLLGCGSLNSSSPSSPSPEPSF
jgi:hypothetical protein